MRRNVCELRWAIRCWGLHDERAKPDSERCCALGCCGLSRTPEFDTERNVLKLDPSMLNVEGISDSFDHYSIESTPARAQFFRRGQCSSVAKVEA